MTDHTGDAPRRTRTTKVSHSLEESLVARLKQLAYSERVSESSIIGFVLSEFFALGDDATLGRIIRDSALTLRRNQPPHVSEPLPLDQLLDELQNARQRLIRAFEIWHEQPGSQSLNAVGLARAEIAAALNQISRSRPREPEDQSASRSGGI